MEAVNNVLFDYERSGSRYTTGIEDHPGEADHVHFDFQFVNNHYLAADDKGMEIEAVTKHGVVDRVACSAPAISAPIGPMTITTRSPACSWKEISRFEMPMRACWHRCPRTGYSRRRCR